MEQHNETTDKNVCDLTHEQQQLARTIGLFSGLVSKFFLQYGGCEVDFKINGEDISDIEKLHELDITERIKLAVKEERYEDAAMLKKLLMNKKGNDL
jgi:hypothetical protein